MQNIKEFGRVLTWLYEKKASLDYGKEIFPLFFCILHLEECNFGVFILLNLIFILLYLSKVSIRFSLLPLIPLSLEVGYSLIIHLIDNQSSAGWLMCYYCNIPIWFTSYSICCSRKYKDLLFLAGCFARHFKKRRIKRIL